MAAPVAEEGDQSDLSKKSIAVTGKFRLLRAVELMTFGLRDDRVVSTPGRTTNMKAKKPAAKAAAKPAKAAAKPAAKKPAAKKK